MDEWLDVAEAALLLDVSPRQVRGLIERDVLPARRAGNSWLVAADAVRSRAARSPGAGRPLSPALAWRLLAVAQEQCDEHGDGLVALRAIDDRRQRHRVRELLATPLSASGWARRLARRAERQSYWVHPGMAPRLARDRRLRVGGAPAAAASGVGISAAEPDRYYVDADVLVAVAADYHLRADRSGPIELMVVPAGAAHDLLDAVGTVPVAVALADLLESDDAREHHEAAVRFERLTLPARP